jgi:hypothetical protein
MDNNASPAINKILPVNYFPQSKEFIFEEDNLIFSSKFDSGNLFSAARSGNLNVK